MSHSKAMSEHIDNLDNILLKVRTNWESTGQDKESYMLELQKQVTNLTIINDNINNFVAQIKNYVRNVQETSNKNV